MTPYTAYPDIQGIIYQDEMDINRLMRTDELYKFSDGTLTYVRTALNDIATRIQMEYLPKRRWTKQDNDEVLKLKNFKKDATFKLFKSTNQERYEHVGPKVTIAQDVIVHKMVKRDYAWLMISKVFKITFSHTSQDKRTSSCLKSKDTTTYSQDVVKERYEVYELKTKDKT
ncbi:hypothetical protein Tco_1320634 [Tanacetum coccineum]